MFNSLPIRLFDSSHDFREYLIPKWILYYCFHKEKLEKDWKIDEVFVKEGNYTKTIRERYDQLKFVKFIY